MTIFLVVRWWVWVAVAFAGLIAGFVGDALLERRRPGWSKRRRQVVAASFAPGLILAGTAIGLLYVAATAPADGWGDLAMGAILAMGVWIALTALVAGFAGALLGSRAAAA
jgi:hypothetical protein